MQYTSRSSAGRCILQSRSYRSLLSLLLGKRKLKKYVVSEKISLKNFTDNTCAPASFCFRTLLKMREIRVNGKRVDSDVSLSAGDEVVYYLTPKQESKQGFEIVYEDENIIVTDKESGVNSEAVFSALCGRGEAYFIHRLDRNTEGLLIFAKNKESEEELLSAFREKRTEKIYFARVLGKMPKTHSVETAYLVKDEVAACVHISAKAVGEKIITEYEVIAEEGETSVLKITLRTGKTHQIRAHLAFLGHPVAGDTKYGNDEYNRAHNLTRQRLVAKYLRIQGNGCLAYLREKIFESQKNL